MNKYTLDCNISLYTIRTFCDKGILYYYLKGQPELFSSSANAISVPLVLSLEILLNEKYVLILKSVKRQNKLYLSNEYVF